MTILPGSLDYLYYNGILPYIPYEAYERIPIQNNGSYTSANNEYQNLITNYKNTTNYIGSDSFRRELSTQENTNSNKNSFRNNILNMFKNTKQDNQKQNINDFNGDNFRKSILNSAEEASNSDKNSSQINKFNIIKGCLASGILLTTLILCFKRKKNVLH